MKDGPDIERVKEMLLQGMSVPAIASELGTKETGLRRYFKARTGQAPGEFQRKSDPEKFSNPNVNVRRIITYLQDCNLAPENVEVRHVSVLLNIPPGTFKKTFASRVGMAYSAYVQMRRIERAKQLLLKSSDTITSIAGQCGFTDGSRMAMVFREKTGESPAAFRERRVKPAPKNNIHVEQILNYLHNANLATTSLRAKDVSSATGIHTIRFERDFQRVIGQAYSEYVTKLKIDEAKALLTQTSIHVPEVAKLSGYSGDASLIKAFKRTIGKTPIEYRIQTRPKWQAHQFRVYLDKNIPVEAAMH